MRGGTHFGDAGDALFGAYTTDTPVQMDTEKFEIPIPGPRGVFRGWSPVFQGYVVDDFDDTMSVFTTESAAIDWAKGL